MGNISESRGRYQQQEPVFKNNLGEVVSPASELFRKRVNDLEINHPEVVGAIDGLLSTYKGIKEHLVVGQDMSEIARLAALVEWSTEYLAEGKAQKIDQALKWEQVIMAGDKRKEARLKQMKIYTNHFFSCISQEVRDETAVENYVYDATAMAMEAYTAGVNPEEIMESMQSKDILQPLVGIKK